MSIHNHREDRGKLQTVKALPKKQKVSLERLTSGSSGKMLSTSLLYRGLSAPQQPQTPEEDKRWGGWRKRERELFN